MGLVKRCDVLNDLRELLPIDLPWVADAHPGPGHLPRHVEFLQLLARMLHVQLHLRKLGQHFGLERVQGLEPDLALVG